MSDRPRGGVGQLPADVAGRVEALAAGLVDLLHLARRVDQAAEPVEHLVQRMAGYAGVALAPFEQFAEQQRALADQMAAWAELQRDFAERMAAWARLQQQLATTLEMWLTPVTGAAQWAGRRLDDVAGDQHGSGRRSQ